ncbi:DNA polymerase III subunit beta [Azospirillum picis]|uniref:Beta sliding clamp n=1 Tax=Azospirillum picis TaxID=488438 RepID=A0ABU0MRU3_9PROT|nr:DNA polymerase III subunit beta [Azospirillum picis]MBP2302557.1 DNA polymerase III beta subunit [Azospirillum picis]MDQ0536201.1 DNA polymerase III beta subunit [Azospirillum picis]
MRIPATCVRDAPLYAKLTGSAGLVTATKLTLVKGGAKVEVSARPQDLPHGAFGRLVRDKIDPLWGARDVDPDGYQTLMDQVAELRERGEGTEAEALLANHFDPHSAANRVARAVYDKSAREFPDQPMFGTFDYLGELAENNPDFAFLGDDEDDDADGADASPTAATDAAAIAEAVKQVPPEPEPTPTNVAPLRPIEAPAAAQPASAPEPAAASQPKGNTPMQFTVDKGPLLSALKRAVAMVGKKTTMPILECVLLDVSDTALTISATDLAMDVQVKLPIGLGAQPGRLAVPGSALATAVDAMPDGAQLSLEAVDAKAEGCRLRILCGKTRFHLPTYLAEDFPAFAQPAGAELVVQVSALKQAIDRVSWAMCSDETKPNLMGMFLHARPEGLRVVACTTNVMSRTDLIVASGAPEFAATFSGTEGPPGILIPNVSVAALRRLLDAVGDETEARLTVGSRRVDLDLFPYRFGTTLSAAPFIGYERTIDFALGQTKQRMTVTRADFLATVRRVRAMAGDKNRALALSITAEGVRVETAERTATDATDIIEAPTGYGGGSLDIGFASGLFVPAIEALNATRLSCELGDPATPTFWRAEQEEDVAVAEHLVVVMPYRLTARTGA